MFSKIAAAVLVVLSSSALAEGPLLRYNIGDSSNLHIQSGTIESAIVDEPEEEEVAVECLDPSNIGNVGTAFPCKDKLIVDNASLKNMVGNGKDYSDTAIYTGQVTSFYELFRYEDVLHSITGWDTSNVTNMSNMFFSSRSFNQNISSWDTSSVTNMQNMLRFAM